MNKKYSGLTARILTCLGFLALAGVSGPSSVFAAGGDGDTAALAPPAQDWSFNGALGTYDRASLQRGFQVYREVCSACHGLEFIAFRNLSQPGGPEFSEAAVKALAAEYTIEDRPDEYGDPFDRPGKASDYFPSPFPNDNAARASSGGALPPDLSVITRARAHGADYLYALLVGYKEPPADIEIADGMSYNPYFGGRQIAMAQPLFEDFVEYSDGTAPTVEQMAKDVTQFLQWASEPELEARKSMGVPTMLYLLVLTVLLYMSYQKVWRDVSKG